MKADAKSGAWRTQAGRHWQIGMKGAHPAPCCSCPHHIKQQQAGEAAGRLQQRSTESRRRARTDVEELGQLGLLVVGGLRPGGRPALHNPVDLVPAGSWSRG